MTHAMRDAGGPDELQPCPKCGCPDLTLDSNSAAEASWIECHNCEHRMQRKCDEETLAERWNKLPRGKMPIFSPADDSKTARVMSDEEAQLRQALNFWYGRAKAAEAALARIGAVS